MKKKVLIIGAGFLQKFVIIKAKQMGYTTLTVDANPDSIGFKYADKHKVINIIDKEACLEYAREEKIDGVLTAATDYGVLTTAYIAENMQLPGISYQVASLIKNKYKVRKRLYEHHVDDTDAAYEVNSEADIQRIIGNMSYPVMVKPCDGSGSRGASRVNCSDELVEACKFAMDSSLTHKAEIETFITGKEYGAETLVSNGEIHVMAIMSKWMTNPPYYAELGHAIPNDLSKDTEAKAIDCVKKAVKALGITSGSVNMDMLVTKEGNIHIVDVGARMGGNLIGSHIIPIGTGEDYMGNMIKTAVSDKIEWNVHNEKKVVVTRLLALTPGIVKSLPDFNSIEKKYQVIIEHHLNEGYEISEYHTNLDGCGYVVSIGDNLQETIQKVDFVKSVIDNSIYRE